MHRLNSHRRGGWYYVAFFCSLLALLTCALAAHAAPGDFTIIHLPDTQYYTKNGLGIFSAQTQWIVNNKNAMNIVYVAHVGDCVDDGNDFMSEWQVADAAIKLIEDPSTTGLIQGIPYGIAVGNHDQTPNGDPTGNSTQLYNTFFGESRFQGRAYYGGHFGTNNDNHFSFFSASGMDFIVVYLEFDPSANPTVLAWADGILKTYSNRRAIVVSHYLIDTGNPAPFGSQGQATYDALKNNPNLFLMLAGHIGEEGRRTDIFNGNTVHTLLADYQDRANGGDGWLRILEFSPSNNQIRVRTYSPWLNQFETDADSEFTLSYNMTPVNPVNQPPGVNAGPDQTITLPSSANLVGTVSDDGLPNPPGAVTTSWSKVSGPGTVTFGNANAVNTTASFSVAGSYVLRLTANDSALQASDDISITVNPAGTNQFPSVNAGPDQTITLPSSANLVGTVSDDGLPNPPGAVTTTWSKVSGPGTVTFGNAAAVNTTASFSAAGSYVLRLTANDSALQASDDISVTVNPAGTTNQAPSVNAGPDQTITLPGLANLDGTVSDDGLPNPPGAVTTTWSKVSGPGTVTFGNAAAVDTTASFSVAGSYVLRLTANDSALQASDDISVTVNAAGAFTAYNDLAWAGGQLNSNITSITSPNGGSGLPSSGQLIDFTTGSGTGVTLTVTGGSFDGSSNATQLSGEPAPGTDAYNVFNGKLTAFGSLSYQDVAPPAGNLVLNFTGLNPNKLYELVFYAHRNDYGWTRASLVTLSGAATFANQSSAATDNPADPSGALFSGPGDDSTRLPSDNDNGYVARFVNIAPGSDGQVALSVSWDGVAGSEYKGKYGNALMLREQGGGSPPPPLNQPPGVNAGPDQTITLPSSANLVGTVSDDGLPNPPGAVTTTWSKVSGPGTVTFGNAAAVNTTASFSVAGSYVLRLTANDSALQTSDDISVTVNAAGPSNQAPAVNAGPDQTITLPGLANLVGTVSDDGLPNPPGAVTTTWSKVSGPGTVTFGNAAAVNTTASFSAAGSYVLRLTANDSALQASDDISVTVNAAGPTNQAPSVNAGPDQTITLPSLANLDGTVSDDGLPNPPGAVTTTWSKVSGPGTVTFGNAAAVDTTASFSVAGSYVLRLTANDSALQASDDISVTVNPAGAFTAYNDLAWAGGQLNSNITSITSPNGGSGLPSSGQLIDFTTGSGTGVTLTVTGGSFDGSSNATQLSGEPAPGTDAYNVFNGKLTAFGSLSYQDVAPPAGNLVLNFTGLNPNKLYELVFYAHRNDYGWTRASLVTLSGAATFANQSSAATDNPADPSGALFSGPGDDSTRLPSDNDNGYVARFVNIAPGSDGQVALSVSWDGVAGSEYKGKYGNALMLREQGGGSPPPPLNQPPGVNAGPDQTITLPSSANLVGTVSDDGLPNPPGAVTTTWSKVSGPGTVTFGNAAAVNTTASFSVAGSYVLRLTANDSALQTSDDISVTVNAAGPSNQAPAVNAGPDQTITLPGLANLVGTVSDDGLPNPPGAVTTTWSKVSGPGTVTFGNAAAVNTTASFSAAGSYVLRLTANDSALQASDDISVTVNAAGPTNQAPSVNAGPDQTITLPSLANLVGTVSDDGLPNPPGAVTTTWSKVSGPGTVTFGNAAAVDTTASFSVAGSYVLRLTANDSALQASDDISVTVNSAGPSNQAPSVNAGPDQTITLPGSANLDGTVSDDGLPNPPGAVTTTWSKVSGPGTVTFGNANAVDTTASFSTTGNYVLRLTANDGALQSSNDIRIRVKR